MGAIRVAKNLRRLITHEILNVLTFFYFDDQPLRPVSFEYDDKARLPQSRGQRQNRRVPAMATGTVKWFNTTKGYGFIAPENGNKDIFVHISAVERSGLTGLQDNQKVSFELQSGRDGRESAVNIELL